MILTYKQCIEKYGSDHMLKKEIAEGNLFRKEKGIYSLNRTCSELEIIGSYRNRVEIMDIAKVEEYATKFKHSDKMMQIMELEVL